MTTLTEAISTWLEKYKKINVKPTTYDRLVTTWRALQQHPISKKDPREITGDDIQNYIADLVESGYSRSTIKKQYCLIRAYLTYALSKGLIAVPVYLGITLPAQSAIKKKPRGVNSYTAEEQKRLWPELLRDDNPRKLAAAFMMETGLRVGECLALQWDDVLWGRRALRVNKTMVRLNKDAQGNRPNGWVLQNTAKSFTSNRLVPLSNRAMELLERMRFAADDREGFLFSRCGHEGLSYESVRWAVESACSDAGVAYLGLHAFRHTFATNCYYRGCDVKILSKLLGHADTSVTYNIYIHLFGDALEEMRSVIG